MRQYSDTRKRKYWHQLNLALLLHAARHTPDAKARSLLRSVLRALDDFVSAFGHLPGARSLLAPLWDDLWTETPQLWSIVGCAYMALCYRADKIEVLRFESDLGDGQKDDITVSLGGKITHVELEAYHRPKFGTKTDSEVETELLSRAYEKANKFDQMRDEHVGVVAVLCVVSDADVDRRREEHLRAVKHIPGRPENVRWMAVRLVGEAHPDGFRFAVKPF